jgi:hypothetical protein
MQRQHIRDSLFKLTSCSNHRHHDTRTTDNLHRAPGHLCTRLLTPLPHTESNLAQLYLALYLELIPLPTLIYSQIIPVVSYVILQVLPVQFCRVGSLRNISANSSYTPQRSSLLAFILHNLLISISCHSGLSSPLAHTYCSS